MWNLLGLAFDLYGMYFHGKLLHKMYTGEFQKMWDGDYKNK